VFVSGYGHFVRTARSLQWDERAVDLDEDRAAWPGLEPGRRARLSSLLAGFCVGEARVAEELGPFADATVDPEAAACFDLQAGDEARHARFFDRFAREVMDLGGADLRQEASPAFLDLFERRLREAVRRLAAGASTLEDAVTLYHLVLEGVVFTAGQVAVLELLEDRSLPGLRRGVELVLRDERWHIGFGTKMLSAAGGAPQTEVLDAAEEAVDAWGDAVPNEVRDRILLLHRRRLRAAGLAQPASRRSSGPPCTPLATPTS
jgi:ribonucleoside-diphosphate reductase beta chain